MSVFSYHCVTCDKPAKQAITDGAQRIFAREKASTPEQSLGTWSCDCTGRLKKTKVRRSKKS
jgi:hypothetical protein